VFYPNGTRDREGSVTMSAAEYGFALLFMCVSLAASVGTYLAWFKPEAFHAYWKWNAKIYRGWNPGAERWMASAAFSQIMRVMVTLLFLVCIYTAYLWIRSLS
jgi:hypothetical protein